MPPVPVSSNSTWSLVMPPVKVTLLPAPVVNFVPPLYWRITRAEPLPLMVMVPPIVVLLILRTYAVCTTPLIVLVVAEAVDRLAIVQPVKASPTQIDPEDARLTLPFVAPALQPLVRVVHSLMAFPTAELFNWVSPVMVLPAAIVLIVLTLQTPPTSAGQEPPVVVLALSEKSICPGYGSPGNLELVARSQADSDLGIVRHGDGAIQREREEPASTCRDSEVPGSRAGKKVGSGVRLRCAYGEKHRSEHCRPIH